MINYQWLKSNHIENLKAFSTICSTTTIHTKVKRRNETVLRVKGQFIRKNIFPSARAAQRGLMGKCQRGHLATFVTKLATFISPKEPSNECTYFNIARTDGKWSGWETWNAIQEILSGNFQTTSNILNIFLNTDKKKLATKSMLSVLKLMHDNYMCHLGPTSGENGCVKHESTNGYI